MKTFPLEAALTFFGTAAASFATRTALWALLFRPAQDALGFGVAFTLATFPLSLVVSLLGGIWAARTIHRAAER